MIPKFRAWDKQKKKFLDDFEIDMEGTVFVRNFYCGSYYDTDFPVAELMQSTGLFDKNGKEIFEGDVVNFEDAEDLENVCINQGLIEWCQGGFTVTNRATVTMADLLDGDNLEVTIIGNIYETPELVKEVQE